MNLLQPFLHWTLKEIKQQSDTILLATNNGGRIMSESEVRLGGLEQYKNDLSKLENLIILGCGTSYYAGLIGINFFKNLSVFNTVQIFDGADFSSHDIPKNGKTGLLLLSQSGETKDLHRCIKIGRDFDLLIISIVNVVGSMIARESDCGVYLNAGKEVGVASTKSFTSQVIVLLLMSIWFAQSKNLHFEKRVQYIKSLHKYSLSSQKHNKQSRFTIR